MSTPTLTIAEKDDPIATQAFQVVQYVSPKTSFRLFRPEMLEHVICAAVAFKKSDGGNPATTIEVATLDMGKSVSGDFLAAHLTGGRTESVSGSPDGHKLIDQARHLGIAIQPARGGGSEEEDFD